MKSLNRTKGNLGEKVAADYLIKNGFEIITQNFADKFGEIDIIASKNKTLSFVEVKTKFDDEHGDPEEMINAGKIKKIQATASVFMNKYPEIEKRFDSLRIDVIAIVMKDNNVLSINYYENVGAEF